MSIRERVRTRGRARARRTLSELASEIRRARAAAGLSQEEVGRRAGVSGDKIWRLEHERAPALSVVDACLVAAVVGLDFSGRTCPNGAPIHDAAQAPRPLRLLAQVGTPLTWRAEVPLARPAGMPELRAWDAVVYGTGERTGIELETRVSDMQATTRSHNRKRADDPVDHFLLVVADTRHNRMVMGELGELLRDLPRLRTATVMSTLREGKHPPTGWILL